MGELIALLFYLRRGFEMSKKKYEKPQILSEEEILQQAEGELLEPETVPEIVPEIEPEIEPEKSTTVLFKFNKRVKYGTVCVAKNEAIEINREDAISFANANHGEIIKVGG